jgi:hypothetical protein
VSIAIGVGVVPLSFITRFITRAVFKQNIPSRDENHVDMDIGYGAIVAHTAKVRVWLQLLDACCWRHVVPVRACDRRPRFSCLYSRNMQDTSNASPAFGLFEVVAERGCHRSHGVQM